MSSAEVLERYHASALTRRRFLATTSMAAAGLATGCGRILELRQGAKKKDREVVVIGAGIAGLTCAYRLHQAGVPVRVFEGQNRVGGRMWSLRDKFPENLVCELGGELVDSNHETLRGLCDELGLALDDFEQDEPSLARDVWFFEGKRMKDEAVVEAFRPIAEQIDAAWETVDGDSVTYDQPNGGEAIDRMSIAQWLDEAGAGGWFRKLLDVGYTTEYGREIGEQSAWNFLMMIDTNPDPFKIFGESDERYHIRGGNDQVPTELGRRLGDRVETGTRLEALAQRPDGTYQISLRRDQTSTTVDADRVVLALPFTKLREVKLDVELPETKRNAIAELGYGTNAKLMVGFSERLWRTQGGSNGSVLTDLPLQLTWESTRLQPGNAGILVCFTGGERGMAIGEGTPAEQSERFARELERVFPGIAERRIGEARFHWPTFEWMKASYACYLPGQWTTICGAEGERVGNLHFAGEHTSVDFQGFMEGGCESGTRAANEILVDLGLAKPEEEEPEEEGAAEKAAAAAG
jgi:monoamine oxidase